MTRARRITILITAVAVALFFILRWLIQQASPMPTTLGVENGRLAPCPDSPNCVSTFAENEEQRMQPLPLNDSPAAAMEQITNAVQATPRARILTSSDTYLHAASRSLTWGFVDDVEFFIDEDAGLIHFRSASRLGYSDMGVNRSRMEELQQTLTE